MSHLVIITENSYFSLQTAVLQIIKFSKQFYEVSRTIISPISQMKNESSEKFTNLTEIP